LSPDQVVDRQQGAQLPGAQCRHRRGRDRRPAAEVAGLVADLGLARAGGGRARREGGGGVALLGHARVVGGERREVGEPRPGVVGTLEPGQVFQRLVADVGGRVGVDAAHGAVHVPDLVVVAAVGVREAVEGRRRGVQRPAVEELAGHGREVPGVLQVPLQGDPLVQAGSLPLLPHAVVVDVAAAQDRGPRRAAARRGRVGLREGHAAVGQPAPGLRHLLDRLGAGVVGDDHEHVGTVASADRGPTGPSRGGQGHDPEGDGGGKDHHHQQPAAHHASTGAWRRRLPRRASRPRSASTSSRPLKRHSSTA